ncbi:GMC family oxidoreductase [Galbitalea soli]|uniref:FAD-binding protein n=1 Tax=Galbitalea soli TaxID=1268042 RepID=A0A7C9PN04_9MICO|nr:GMC family oxidoreductase N-terminal domain-containing protein [Galbitalea soli]NEM91069.1 FAD-binding protein [Galbitalea soli]NYJ29757.1 choline dehydrogenase [Galbitalea soli]
MDERPEVIVVGAGSAGSVIARRLVDAGKRVLLLEAGGSDENPVIQDPARLGEIWHSSDDWDYFTVPQRHAADRRLHLPRGRVLGGSHSLNAMIYVRCAPQDYDHWESLGNTGWGWKDVLPVFKKIENYDGPPSDLRGTGGLLDVTVDYPLNPIQQSIIDAAVESGIPENPDYNGEELDGVARQQLTIRDGERLSTWRAYAAPILDSPLFTVVTGAWVHRLLLDGTRVIGVEYERAGEVIKIEADQVVLTAGAIDSPRVLLRSGIGPATELARLGIDVVADLPGVGENLHDHLLSPVIFSTDREIEPPIPGTGITQSHLFWRSAPELEVPDTQPIHFSVPMYEDWMEGPAWGFTLMGGIITPASRGRLTLAGPEPRAGVLIDLNALAEEADLLALEASVRQVRAIGTAPALAEGWGAREIYPGPEVDDDASLRDYVRRTVITYHHQVGTCKMGVDELAVVDPRLRVYGVTGLMVADASIMPRVTSGNTNAPTIMIGEKAAEFFLN